MDTTSKASASSVIKSISPFKINSSVGQYIPASYSPENTVMVQTTKEQEKEIYRKLPRELTDIQEK